MFDDVEDALETYNTNIECDTIAKVQSCVYALRYLLINRPAGSSINGINLNYASLENEKIRLEQILNDYNRISFTSGRPYNNY